MNQIIVVAGATGNLGGKIVQALIKRGAVVRAVVRTGTKPERIETLEMHGALVFEVDMNDQAAIAGVCTGADCVVSALAGLEETILETQKILLDAAVEAQVARFIPSDYSIDFSDLIAGTNRNLDLRRTFHTYLDRAPIRASSIFNGSFMDLLTAEMPLIQFKRHRILYWGKPDQVMDFTSTENVAAFTAHVALDKEAPRRLRIAGDRKNAQQLVAVMDSLSGQSFKLTRAGSIGLLNILIKMAKFFAPGRNELYPAWQGMQYMRDMMEGRVVIDIYDNNRYADMQWTTIKKYLSKK